MQAAGDPAPGPGPRVSIILPVHNAEPWLDECLNSVLQQDFEGTMELSVFNDASKDKSGTIIEKWKVKLEASGILVVIGGHDSPSPRGVGYSKNQAIAQSSGSYLCFLDSDDVMMSQRVRLQHEAAVQHPTSGGGISPWEGGHVTEGDLQPIVGCRVRRDPPESTGRYTRWINRLTPDQLLTQVFTSNGPTVIMPTWFCSRAWFSHVGRFDEGGQGVPEDLLFFHEHLRKGGGVVRVDQTLLLYRHHPQAATHSVLEATVPFSAQGHALDPPRPLPGGARPAALGHLHHLERGQAGPPAVPQPQRRRQAQGGRVLRRGPEQDREGLLLLRGLSGTAQAPGARPALPSSAAALRHLREAGPHRGRVRGQPEVAAPAGGPGLPALQLTDPAAAQ
ncbi:UDP-GlcNAc:betaGal beta-1,3-N-acetylglucosaminyltransferase-like protein 1 isoform X2 [Lemur catta]|nr:UDP-GlcNAc:betaGal beta-1,3-N-acetylglucosaminyltransferase-like protein 1 isoform X2 [Lemur catta]